MRFNLWRFQAAPAVGTEVIFSKFEFIPAPSLVAVSFEGGELEVEVTAQSDVSHVIEGSTDFATWEEVRVLTPVEEVTLVSLLSDGLPFRFYRAVIASSSTP